MSDDNEETPTAAEILDAVARDTESGIEQFTDGDTTVRMFDPVKRLAALEKIQRAEVAADPLRHSLGSVKRAISPGAWD